MAVKNSTADERGELIRRAQSGDTAALEQLTEDNKALVWSIVQRYMGRGVDSDDLFQLGCIGLIKAIQGFDLSLGTQLSTYAVPKIAGEIRRFLRDDGLIKVSRTTKSTAAQIARLREAFMQKNSREPTLSELSAESGLSIEEIASSENAMLPADYLQRPLGDDGGTLEQMLPDTKASDNFFEYMALREALDKLEAREKKLILMRYFRAKTQQQCADALGVSQVQVSRMERRIIEKLRGWMEAEE